MKITDYIKLAFKVNIGLAVLGFAIALMGNMNLGVQIFSYSLFGFIVLFFARKIADDAVVRDRTCKRCKKVYLGKGYYCSDYCLKDRTCDWCNQKYQGYGTYCSKKCHAESTADYNRQRQ